LAVQAPDLHRIPAATEWRPRRIAGSTRRWRRTARGTRGRSIPAGLPRFPVPGASSAGDPVPVDPLGRESESTALAPGLEGLIPAAPCPIDPPGSRCPRKGTVWLKRRDNRVALQAEW